MGLSALSKNTCSHQSRLRTLLVVGSLSKGDSSCPPIPNFHTTSTGRHLSFEHVENDHIGQNSAEKSETEVTNGTKRKINRAILCPYNEQNEFRRPVNVQSKHLTPKHFIVNTVNTEAVIQELNSRWQNNLTLLVDHAFLWIMNSLINHD
ncbi:hypothetical protein TNCV_2060311 [Trichonephila clavipes]|nr:hypothetical protein TNCV_2060311 [Trichonephila clavipes]